MRLNFFLCHDTRYPTPNLAIWEDHTGHLWVPCEQIHFWFTDRFWYFCVTFSPFPKVSPGARPFIWITVLIHKQMKLISKWMAVHRSYLSKEAKGNLEMGNCFITQEHRFSNKGEGVTLRDTQSTYKVVMSPPMLHSSWMQTRPLFKNIFQKLIDGWLILASIGGMWPNCSLKVLKCQIS